MLAGGAEPHAARKTGITIITFFMIIPLVKVGYSLRLAA
jgi:hypothetical protein